MKKKYLNIALGVFVAVAFVSFLLSAAGMRVPGLTKISIILMMAVLVVNAIYDMARGAREVHVYDYIDYSCARNRCQCCVIDYGVYGSIAG